MNNKTFFYFLLIVVLIIFSNNLRAQDCYESTIVSPSPFMGNNGEIFKLDDGSVWEVKYEYEYLYEYYPTVIICPKLGKLTIGEKTLSVEFVSGTSTSNTENSEKSSDWEIFEETNIKGTVSGTIKKGSILKTVSGNVYEVTGVTIQVVVEVQPDVMVLRNINSYKLIVDGFDEPLICKCLNCTLDKKSTKYHDEHKPQEYSVIESTIISEFDGLKKGNIYKLGNGQIWEQTESWIWLWTWINPSVMVWKEGSQYKMKVDQIDHAVFVKRIK